MMNKLLEKSATDFLEIYKDKLHKIGIKADSDSEKMLISVLIDTAKEWSIRVQLSSKLFKGKK